MGRTGAAQVRGTSRGAARRQWEPQLARLADDAPVVGAALASSASAEAKCLACVYCPESFFFVILGCGG